MRSSDVVDTANVTPDDSHKGPCRRTWTDIVGRPGSGNRYNCTNAMGRARGSSRVNNVQQASASADGEHDGSALQDSPPSPFIMHYDHGHMLSYIRISGDELGGTRGRNGRAQPSYSSYVQVRALSLSPAFSNRRFHFAHVSPKSPWCSPYNPAGGADLMFNTRC